MNQLRFKILDDRAQVPRKGSREAAGFDLSCLSDTTIYPDQTMKVRTGVAVAIPSGHVGIVKDRSGMSIHGLVTRAGVIDSDYRGELIVVLHNESGCIQHFEEKTRVAQLLVLPLAVLDNLKVVELDETERGDGGFGSTGTA